MNARSKKRLTWTRDALGRWKSSAGHSITLDINRGFIVTKDDNELGFRSTLPAAKHLAKETV